MHTADLQSRDVLKGLAAGIIGGVVASAVMNQFQKIWGRYLLNDEDSHGAQSLQKGSPESGAGRMLQEKGADDPEDDSAERLAQTVAVGVFDRKLDRGAKDKAGTMFHYAYGTSMGAVYGAAAEIWPRARAGAGSLYGAAIWVGADEVAVPALGLSKPGWKYPLPILVAALAAHLVYGVTLEAVRGTVRNMI